MRRVSLCGSVGVLALAWSIPDAAAWWAEGHGAITQGAVSHLPPPLYGYFHANVTTLANYAGQEPTGTHYIDIDYYPEFFAGTFPHDKNVLIAMYGSSVVNSNGVAPWTLADYVVSLSNAMATARTGSDWSALLLTAGELAHYAEDLHNPLHLTQNYNGQLTGNTGIHSRYEGTMVAGHLADLAAVPDPAACVYVASPIDTIFDGIDADYVYVQPILDADRYARTQSSSYNSVYYAALWSRTGGFTQALFQDASELTASLWYTAWVNAGEPTPILGADLDADGDIDLADFGRFQTCFNGPNRAPRGAGCAAADLDGDGDADLSDFGRFQACFNGPNQPPKCQ